MLGENKRDKASLLAIAIAADLKPAGVLGAEHLVDEQGALTCILLAALFNL
jgi:hypothetical protein